MIDFKSMLLEWRDFLVGIRGLSQETARGYLRHIESFSRWLSERGDEVTSASESDIEAWLKDLWRSGKKSSSRASMLAPIKNFYDFLVRAGVMSGSPAARVPYPKVDDTSARKFSAEELRVIFSGPDAETLQGIRDRAMLMFMYGAGPRVSEIRKLAMSDCLFTAQTCIVTLDGKGAKERTLKLLAAPTAALKTWHDVRMSQGAESEHPVFISLTRNEGREVPELSAESINKVLKKFAADAGVAGADAFVHKVRSTFATDLYDEIKDIMVVAAKMGHTDVKTTMKYIVISETALNGGVISNRRWRALTKKEEV